MRRAAAKTRLKEERGETINLRANAQQKALIDGRPKHSAGAGRISCSKWLFREAESILLDRRYFVLPEDGFKNPSPCSIGRPRTIRGCGGSSR
jgi:hypothetical protein